MTCNVTELRHHIAWFDDENLVYCIDEGGQPYEIIRLQDDNESPVMVIRIGWRWGMTTATFHGTTGGAA